MRVTGKCFSFMESLGLQRFFFFLRVNKPARENFVVELQLGNAVLESENLYLAITVALTQTRQICTVKERDITGLVESQCASLWDICNCKGRQDNFKVEKVHHHSTSVFVKENRTSSGWKKCIINTAHLYL